MAIIVPKALKPVFDFTFQVVLGAIAFIIVFLVAVGITWIVKYVEATGIAPNWVIRGAEFSEKTLFAVDLFCFGLFLLCEALKLIKGLWAGWRE